MNIWQLVQTYKAMFRPPVEDLLGASEQTWADELHVEVETYLRETT